MAYSRRSSGNRRRGSARRVYARAGSRSTGARRTSRSRSGGRKAAPRHQTLKIVIEHATGNPVARPATVEAALSSKTKKSKF